MCFVYKFFGTLCVYSSVTSYILTKVISAIEDVFVQLNLITHKKQYSLVQEIFSV